MEDYVGHRQIPVEFEQEISTKTGWGKNEIMVAFDKATVRAMIRFARDKGVELT